MELVWVHRFALGNGGLDGEIVERVKVQEQYPDLRSPRSCHFCNRFNFSLYAGMLTFSCSIIVLFKRPVYTAERKTGEVVKIY